MAHEKAVVVCLLVAASIARADKPYTLADLETLVADRSYEEAVAHLGDVAPSQRTPKWTDVAASATAGLLGTLPDDAKLGAIDAIDRAYPVLRKTVTYARARAQHGVTGLASCYRASRDCGKLGLKLAEGGDRGLVIDVARVTAPRDPELSVTLWRRVLDKATCRDPALTQATIAAISNTTPATEARAIAQTCWDDVKGALVEAFDHAGKGGYLYKNTCDLLEAKGALSSLQRKRCRAK